MSSTKLNIPSEEECLKIFDSLNIKTIKFDDNGVSQNIAVRKVWGNKFNNENALMTAQFVCDQNGNGVIDRNEFTFFIRFLAFYHNGEKIFEKINLSDEEGGFMIVSKDDFVHNANDLLGNNNNNNNNNDNTNAEQIFDNMAAGEGLIQFYQYCTFMAVREQERADDEKAAKEKKEKEEALRRQRQQQQQQASAPSAAVSVPSKPKRKRKKAPTAIDVPSEEECLKAFDSLRVEKMKIGDLDRVVAEIWPKFSNKDALQTAQFVCDLNGNEEIERNEFTFFLRFLSFYNNYWYVFEPLNLSEEGGGSMVVSREDFVKNAEDLQIFDADLIFDDISAGGDHIQFFEYCLHMAMQTNERKLSSGASFFMANAGSSKFLSTARLGIQEKSYLTLFITDLRSALGMLKATVSDGEIEKMAFLIHNQLANESRQFHSTDRVFATSELADPVQMVAALFQDIIYYEIDDGITSDARKLLRGVIDPRDPCLISKNIETSDDRLICMVTDIFNYSPGQRVYPVPSKFLSSCVAVRFLKDALPIKELLKIVACIRATASHQKESTDDFYNNLIIALPQSPGLRLSKELSEMGLNNSSSSLGSADTSSKSASASAASAASGSAASLSSYHQSSLRSSLPNNKGVELNDLYDGLVKANDRYLSSSERLTKPKLVKAVQRAADMSNRTNGAFCDPDPNESIDVVWGLLPEITPALRDRKLYTVFDYHQGVCNLFKALNALDPNTLYVSYQGIPQRAELSSFIRCAETNKHFAIAYTNVKVVSMAIVAAFCQLTGGNVPMSFFMGDRKGDEYQMGEDLVKATRNNNDGSCGGDYEKDVYESFLNGRKTERPFDRRKSPLSAYIYKELGDMFISKKRIIKLSTEKVWTEDKAWNLLKEIPFHVVSAIGIELTKATHTSRKDAFESTLIKLSKETNNVGGGKKKASKSHHSKGKPKGSSSSSSAAAATGTSSSSSSRSRKSPPPPAVASNTPRDYDDDNYNRKKPAAKPSASSSAKKPSASRSTSKNNETKPSSAKKPSASRSTSNNNERRPAAATSTAHSDDRRKQAFDANMKPAAVATAASRAVGKNSTNKYNDEDDDRKPSSSSGSKSAVSDKVSSFGSNMGKRVGGMFGRKK